MANMALTIEQRLGQKLTNEQLLLWNYALNLHPYLTFRPYYFSGAQENAMFYNLTPSISFLAYSITSGLYETKAALMPTVFDNEAGNTIYVSYNSSLAVSPQRNFNHLEVTNIYFSRAQILNATVGLGFFKFIGYIIYF